MTAALLLIFGSPAMAADLIFDTSQPNITTPQTANDSFWVGNNASNVSVNIVSPGSVTVNGVGNSAALGNNASSDGNSLGISGADAALTVEGDIYVGYAGASNALAVELGADVSSGSFYMGAQSGSTDNTFDLETQGQVITTGDAAIGLAGGGNSATVSGSGTLWSIGGHLYIGNASAGNSLTISNGGVVDVFHAANTVDMLIGAAPGADHNSVTVTGSTSDLSIKNTLYVGRSGNANTLQITSGGLVDSGNVRIGGGSGAMGTPTGNGVSVGGANSTWNIAGTLRVGAGTATNIDNSLDVTNGGVVNVGGNGFVGYDDNSDDNHVLVSGTGSQLNVTGSAGLTISRLLGATGNVVTVADGGVLSVTHSIAIGVTGGPNASGLTIGEGSAPGSISPATTLTGAGDDPFVRFNHSSGNYAFASSLAGTLRVVHDGSGTTFLTGTNGYTGETVVNGGVLALNGVTATSGITVNAGTLGVAAGAAATTTGNYTQVAGSTYRTYIADNTTYGTLQVNGTVSLPSTAQIGVVVTNCAAVTPGATFTGVMTSSNPIAVSVFTVTDNCPGLDFEAGISGSSVSLAIIEADGIIGSIEDGVPNGGTVSGTGDGNGDGTPDSLQPHVASLPTGAGPVGSYATLASGAAGITFTNVSASGTPGDAPPGVTFPYGQLTFTLNGVGTGATVTVTLYVPYNTAVNGYWKKDTGGTWANIATSLVHDAASQKTIVQFPLMEGGVYDFDSDPTTITDPGGVGILAAAPVGAPQPIPSLSAWGTLILSALLGSFGLRRSRLNSSPPL